MKIPFLPKLRHTLAVGALALAAAIPAAAADGGEYVAVLTTAGDSFTALISDVTRIDLGSEKLTVVTPSASAEYAYGDVDRILIGCSREAAVADLTADGSVAVWPLATTDIVNVAGAQPGAKVAVYSAAGALVSTGVADSTGALTLNVGAAPTGVCIVSVDGRSVKIIKK